MIEKIILIKGELTTEVSVEELKSKSCCRQRVGRMRSLSLGFGEKVFHGKNDFPDDFYGEWEIGSYYSEWRVIRAGEILCGSQNTVESIAELDNQLNTIQLGRVIKIENFSKFDVRVSFDNNICAEFFWCSNDDDEVFHVFGPKKLCAEYSVGNGWRVGQSDKPW